MRFSVRKLVLMGVLTAAALIIFIFEAQIPLPVNAPGIKLGLANAVTLFALFLGAKEIDGRLPVSFAFMILVCRIVLGALLTGRVIAFAYSLSGGLLAFAVMAVMRRFVSDKQIWVCGAFGAMFHNIGQICAAMVITGIPAVAAYLPALIAAGVITGAVTGFVAQFALARLRIGGFA